MTLRNQRPPRQLQVTTCPPDVRAYLETFPSLTEGVVRCVREHAQSAAIIRAVRIRIETARAWLRANGWPDAEIDRFVGEIAPKITPVEAVRFTPDRIFDWALAPPGASQTLTSAEALVEIASWRGVLPA